MGRGSQSVREALSAQKTKASDIRNFRSKVDEALTSEVRESTRRQELFCRVLILLLLLLFVCFVLLQGSHNSVPVSMAHVKLQACLCL